MDRGTRSVRSARQESVSVLSTFDSTPAYLVLSGLFFCLSLRHFSRGSSFESPKPRVTVTLFLTLADGNSYL